MVPLVGCKPQFEQLPREQIIDVDNQQGETSSQPTRNDVEPAVSFSDIPSLPNQKAIGNIQFQNVTKETGLDFTYQNGADGRLLMVESLGGGVAWLDYDLDGRLDTYFTQGGKPDEPDSSNRPSDCLFRQLTSQSFLACEQMAGIVDQEYGQGVAVGDFNNDGLPDIYVTNVGANSFFENMGDGTFLKVAEEMGLDDPRWSSSAAWGDLDLDGDLDLYLCNYVQYDPYSPITCEKDGLPALCHPRQIPHWEDECFENLGDGRFAKKSFDWNLYGDGNKGLGVSIADFSNDGWPDIYVANDTTANFLFINQKGQGFEEAAVKLGAALSGDGAMQASMGVATADVNRDGTLDLFLTHFTGESHTLYKNQSEFGFLDISGISGIHQASFPKLGFGTVMTDFDANGTDEIMVTHGHIDDRNADGDGYEQTAQLLIQSGNRWIDYSGQCGDYFQERVVGRGLATGDFDNDGDLDVCIVHQNSPVALLENHSTMGKWLKIRLIGSRTNRTGIGTRITLDGGDQEIPGVWELAGGTSYCSTHQAELYLGLGERKKPITVEIHWPVGETQYVRVEEFNVTLTMVQSGPTFFNGLE